MHPILRNILAVLAGIILGSLVNMGIIMISGAIIPPPEGVDVTNMESLKASMHLFGPQHFIFPWLAHAIGTLAGAVVAALIAAKNKLVFALLVGVFFLMGGIANIFMLPSPLWFSIVDLGGAYLPMGWLGARISSGLTKK
ncbi:MAG: hypothetical protein KKD74_07585 [Bacteroidetes bacterium]|nr:hypothetical protein [Bacteroidota bacterium]